MTMRKVHTGKFAVIPCAFVLLTITGAFPFNPDSLRNQLRPLDLSKPPVASPAEERYFRFYGIDFPGATHLIGTFRSDSFVVAAQVFKPEHATGTIVCIHGYYDHTGLLKPLIRESLARSYAFAAIDLPGHGLSTGERASIRDFSQYRDALREFLTRIKPFCPGPYVLAGHSTGCSVVYEYLVTVKDTAVSRAIFAAPLVRSAWWIPGKLGYALLSPFSSENRRWFRKSSHDAGFLTFQKKDPLGYSSFPLPWAKALYAWEKRTREYQDIATPVIVIQGTNDETVDWRYNCRFLERKCSRSAIHYIRDARHHLINEGEPYRSKFMELFFAALFP